MSLMGMLLLLDADDASIVVKSPQAGYSSHRRQDADDHNIEEVRRIGCQGNVKTLQ